MRRAARTVEMGRAAAPLVLALDIGTSGLRAMLFDLRGRVVQGSVMKAPLALRTTDEGEASVDAQEVVRSIASLIDGVIERAGRRARDIVAVATSAFWHSLLGVDRSGRPTTRALTWADTSARADAAALRAELDPVEVHARTGAWLHASYWPAKLRFLRRADPDAFARTAAWLGLGEYLQLRLFGSTWSAHGMSSATGLYSQAGRTWDVALTKHLGIDVGTLPLISDRPAEGLRPAFARRWPALARVPWLPAIGDGACSNVGCGAVGRETAAIFMGTSGAIRVVFDSPTPPPIRGGWSYRLDDRYAVAGGALSNGGNVLNWLSRVFPSVDPSRLRTLDPRSGAVALPLLHGDRSPTWDDAASAAIAGLSLSTTAEDIARAVILGVVCRVDRVWESIRTSLPDVRSFRATGTAFDRHPWLVQLVADAVGSPVSRSPVEHGSARGAAIVALARVGATPGIADSDGPSGREYRPRAASRARLLEEVERQRMLEDALSAMRSDARDYPHGTAQGGT